ncbi:MAG: tRNA dihydrouridine(20/20a) synthase DusA [Gammaproteobacteria bacterium]
MTTMIVSEPLPPRRLSIAPMMNRTDRHFRYLVRLITRCTWLYTEMLVARALLHGDPDSLLAHDAAERPLALQLGGSEPDVLAVAARLAVEHGFDEVNLNVGCPSSRVTAGRMGACLMGEPDRVADCVAAMRAASNLPITVKTRIGIDERDDFEFLCGFVEAVSAAGCNAVIVHARKAWLSGLNPKANRTVPRLDYERVYALKLRYPSLEIVVNGGIADLDTAAGMLKRTDGVMLGRGAYADPLLLVEADARFYSLHRPAATLGEVLAGYLDYLARRIGAGDAPAPALRHLSTLLNGLAGARSVRRRLGALAGTRDMGAVERALAPFLTARAA